MTSTNFQDLEISRDIRIRADWERATSNIWWQGLDDDEEWHNTPYTVADAGHNQEEALRLVDGWLDTESPAY